MDDIQIVYINLDSRKDRNETMRTELEKMRLVGARFPAIFKGQTSVQTRHVAAMACTKSHIAVLQKALDDKVDFILVMEDDFEFHVSRSELDEKIVRFRQDFKLFDVLMFTYGNMKYNATNQPDVGQVVSAHNAGGYLVSRHYIPKLIANFEEALELYTLHPNEHWVWSHDQHWKRLQKIDQWYCFYPPLGYQRPGYSDIVKRDRTREEIMSCLLQQVK